jgi:hypothetical protein
VHEGRGWRWPRCAAPRCARPTHLVDYVPGALVAPQRSALRRPCRSPPTVASAWFILWAAILSSLRAGFSACRHGSHPIRVMLVTLLTLGLAVALDLGKFLFDERHIGGRSGSTVPGGAARQWMLGSTTGTIRRSSARGQPLKTNSTERHSCSWASVPGVSVRFGRRSEDPRVR